MRALYLIPKNPPPKLSDKGLWSKDFRDFLKQALVRNPAKRPGCTPLLKHAFFKVVAEKPATLVDLVTRSGAGESQACHLAYLVQRRCSFGPSPVCDGLSDLTPRRHRRPMCGCCCRVLAHDVCHVRLTPSLVHLSAFPTSPRYTTDGPPDAAEEIYGQRRARVYGGGARRG